MYVYFFLQGEVLEHNKQILLIDRDSPEVNNYDIKITDDPLNLLKHECDTFLENRENEPQTVIHCSKYTFIVDDNII